MKKYIFTSLISLTLFIGLGSVLQNQALAEDLRETLRDVLANSKSLGSQRQAWLASREDIGTKTSTKDLSATFSASASNSYSGLTGNGTSSTTGSASIALSKNLYDGGKSAANTKAAEISLQISEMAYLKTEQAVITEGISAFLSVIKTRKEAEIQRANIQRLEEHVKAAKIRVAAGATTPTSVAEAEARLAKATSNGISAENGLVNAEDVFSSLVGRSPGKLDEPAALPALPETVAIAEQTASKSHPDIITARLSTDAAAQQFDVLKSSVGPSLSMSVTASEKEGRDDDSISASLDLSVPLWATNATKASARKTAASFEKAKLSESETIRKTTIEVRKAYRNWKSNSVNVSAVKSELNAAELVLKGISNETTYGQKTVLDLLDAEQDVNDARLRLVDAEHKVLQASFSLLAAIGKLTAADLDLDGVMSRLQDLPTPPNPFSTTFPFRRLHVID